MDGEEDIEIYRNKRSTHPAQAVAMKDCIEKMND